MFVVSPVLYTLIPVIRKPRMEDMLKGYIIKSRIRETDKILLAQPYSPHLFRQGVLPGPGLLLEVLLGKKTTPARRLLGKSMRRRSRRGIQQERVGSWNKHYHAADAQISIVEGRYGNQYQYIPCHKTPRCYGRVWFGAVKISYAGPVVISYNGVCQTQ